MLIREAFVRAIGVPSAIDLSQSVDLSDSINSAARLLGREMSGPEIRAAHDKVVLAATAVGVAPSILAYIKTLEKTAGSEQRRKELNQQLDNLRQAAGLTLSRYYFTRDNPFPGGWGLVIYAVNDCADAWNKLALLFPWSEDNGSRAEYDLPVKPNPTEAPEIKISLAQISSPYPDMPEAVKATLLPLVRIKLDAKIVKPQPPETYKIYNAHRIITPVTPGRFHRPIYYPGK